MDLRDLSRIDNKEFNFIVLSSIVSLLLNKEIITEEELSDMIQETSSALSHIKSEENFTKSDEF
tara:strand:- start:1497 stop:1688 length:192 start_codon:yes stop_codon:yes gene_type:complete